MTAASVPPPTPLRAAAAELRAHQDWLGFVQPVGLVVSLPALDKAQCYVNRNAGREQQVLRALAAGSDPPSHIPHFRALATQVLGWEETNLVEPPEALFLPLPEYGEVLARLLALNAERAAEERLLGAEAALRKQEPGAKKAATAKTPRKKSPTGGEGQGGLFD